jgi:predicted PurR-regulated permease PerM
VIGLIIGLGSLVTFLSIDDPYFVPLAIIMGMNGLIPTIGCTSTRQESDKRQIHRDARSS